MGKFNMSKYESKYKKGKYTPIRTRYPDFSQKTHQTLPSSSINNNYTTKPTTTKPTTTKPTTTKPTRYPVFSQKNLINQKNRQT